MSGKNMLSRRRALGNVGAAGALIGSSGSAKADTQRPLNATWVHGTSFQAEDAGGIVSTTRFAWGATFRGRPGSSNWFHVSVPVPVFTGGDRSAIERVFVLYKTNGAQIHAIHVFDGPNKIKEFGGLNLSGDHSRNAQPTYTAWEVTPGIELAWGLGISVAVTYSVGFDSPVSTEITFSTAGADSRTRTPH